MCDEGGRYGCCFFFSSRRRHTRCSRDWSSDVCSSDLLQKWNGFGWSTVAWSEGPASEEQVTYNGTSGYYRWRVYSYFGSGSRSEEGPVGEKWWCWGAAD